MKKAQISLLVAVEEQDDAYGVSEYLIKHLASIGYQATCTAVGLQDAEPKPLLGPKIEMLQPSNEIKGIKKGSGIFDETKPFITVYTDGGCLGVGKAGAWAWVAELSDGTTWEHSGVNPNTSNNQMEMWAVINGLQFAQTVLSEFNLNKVSTPIKVVSDSEYVINGATVWHKNWIKNGWHTSEGLPVKNKEIWQVLLGLALAMEITWEHVKGHTGHPQNEHCDKLCTAQIAAYMKSLTAAG